MDTFAAASHASGAARDIPLTARAACSVCLTGLDVPSIEDSSLSQTLAVDYDLDAL